MSKFGNSEDDSPGRKNCLAPDVVRVPLSKMHPTFTRGHPPASTAPESEGPRSTKTLKVREVSGQTLHFWSA